MQITKIRNKTGDIIINLTEIKRIKRILSTIKSQQTGAFLVAQWKNPPANAVDTGSSPGPGRSHMAQSS